MKSSTTVVLMATCLFLFRGAHVYGSGTREKETFVYVCEDKTKLGILTVAGPSGLAHTEEKSIGVTIDTNTWGKSISISPDGQWIAYCASSWIRHDVYISRTTGDAAPIRQTDTDTVERWPEWSPDGKSIVFTTDVEPEPGNLLQLVCKVSARFETASPMNEPKVIVSAPGYYSDPAYAPNGRSIAYLNICVTPFGEIVIVDAVDGVRTNSVSLGALSLVRGMSLRWQPDRRFLFAASAVAGESMGPSHCYVSDGQSMTDITQNETSDCLQPSWYKDERSFLPWSYSNRQVIFMSNNGLYSIREGHKSLIHQFDYDYPNPVYKPRHVYPMR